MILIKANLVCKEFRCTYCYQEPVKPEETVQAGFDEDAVENTVKFLFDKELKRRLNALNLESINEMKLNDIPSIVLHGGEPLDLRTIYRCLKNTTLVLVYL